MNIAEHSLVIPEHDWRKLLAAANGDSALLYLYLRAGGDAAEAETALHLSAARRAAAESSLRQLGLWQEKPKLLRPVEPPTYTEAELAERLQSGTFPQLLGEAQRRLGRVLSTEEMKILLSMNNYLGLSDEVISILISYCLHRARLRGSSRPPSMRTIEREAYAWADLGIETLEEAAAHVQQELEQQTIRREMQRVLQLSDRRLFPKEEAYLNQWIAWGFSPREVSLAFERACLKIGHFNWKYINSILESWHSQGLHTVSAIETGDKAPAKAAPQEQQPNQWAKDAVARMMRQEEEQHGL